MVCLECEDLAKIYFAYLDAYVDMIESRNLVDHVWPELQTNTRVVEAAMWEAWYWLSEHRSIHHVVQSLAGSSPSVRS
jgi:hypothetical protein